MEEKLKMSFSRERLDGYLTALEMQVNAIKSCDGVSSHSAFFAYLTCAFHALSSARLHLDEIVYE